ncbi:SIR2 family protein [Pseudoalteromonas maricaloris]|uniref:SIR2 family protein n=1 Tax=Pseudoalteromonas maricaloris TaxID=184924 RepID=UPI000299EC95|nr:SIR2 family protein [Pseudoalteromonas flavipulchra]
MASEFKLLDIYEQNLNFLIGAGASYGFLPTLALEAKDEIGNKYTFETLAKKYESNEQATKLLFMLYYQECIRDGLPKVFSSIPPNPNRPPEQESVVHEYKRFLSNLINVLNRQKPSERRANIFTTNYDNCFETATEELLSERAAKFIVNDGSVGFQKRTFHTSNFNHRVVNKGAFDRHDTLLPQVNLLHAHGSVHWEQGQSDNEINLNYGQSSYIIIFDQNELDIIRAFKGLLYDSTKSLSDIEDFLGSCDFSNLRLDYFWDKYTSIPIVNPTKWKFHETLFEEAYYQILRHLSYELERPNSVLITFGFSFADEHLLSLIRRALSNPSLTMYVSCFNNDELMSMQDKFKDYSNVGYICSEEGDLDFKHFNDAKFTLDKYERKSVGQDSIEPTPPSSLSSEVAPYGGEQ